MKDPINPYETLILGIIVGFIPSLLILGMTIDAEARAECLITTYELKNTLEQLDIIGISEADSKKYIYDTKLHLEKLTVQKAKLLFSYHPMNRLISKSLFRIRKMDDADTNRAYHTVQTGQALCDLFRATNNIELELSKLDYCQKFLSRSLPLRCLIWIRYQPTRLSDYLKNIKAILTKRLIKYLISREIAE